MRPEGPVFNSPGRQAGDGDLKAMGAEGAALDPGEYWVVDYVTLCLTELFLST